MFFHLFKNYFKNFLGFQTFILGDSRLTITSFINVLQVLAKSYLCCSASDEKLINLRATSDSKCSKLLFFQLRVIFVVAVYKEVFEEYLKNAPTVQSLLLLRCYFSTFGHRKRETIFQTQPESPPLE